MSSSTKIKRVRVQLIKSSIGCKPKHRATVRAIGLRKIGQERDVKLNQAMKGMLKSVSYLIAIKKIDNDDEA